LLELPAKLVRNFDAVRQNFEFFAELLDVVHKGAGSPEGVVTAPVGHVYFRSDGGAATTFYVKESGVGNTGWVAK
jgi:hypothetical protein